MIRDGELALGPFTCGCSKARDKIIVGGDAAHRCSECIHIAIGEVTPSAREFAAMAELYQDRVWNFQFLYFPHVWAQFDEMPGIFNIEYILHGGGTIEGLPEGVGPSEINMNDLDDTFSYSY